METNDSGGGQMEDRGVLKRAMTAVGSNSQAVNDETLELCLGQVAALKQRLGLTFRCHDLPNLDRNSKTDAFIVLWKINSRGMKEKVGQTEMVADNLDPEFVTEIIVDYFFEEQQNFLCEVYDVDDATNIQNLRNQEFIGSYNFKLGNLVAARNQELNQPIESSTRKNSGKIHIMADEKKDDYGKMQAKFTVSAKFTSKMFDNCFFTINRMKNPGQFQPVFKSECKPPMNGEISFNEIILDTHRLCDADNEQPILFQGFHFNKSGNHAKIGQAEITLSQLIDIGGGYEVSLGNGDSLMIKNFEFSERVSFLDYIMGGCEIGVHIAIDFTLSNGDPK